MILDMKKASWIEIIVIASIVILIAFVVILPIWNAYETRGMTSGIVVKKKYNSSSGKFPEYWTITISGTNRDGEMKQKNKRVDGYTYHRLEVGQEVNLNDL